MSVYRNVILRELPDSLVDAQGKCPTMEQLAQKTEADTVGDESNLVLSDVEKVLKRDVPESEKYRIIVTDCNNSIMETFNRSFTHIKQCEQDVGVSVSNVQSSDAIGLDLLTKVISKLSEADMHRSFSESVYRTRASGVRDVSFMEKRGSNIPSPIRGSFLPPKQSTIEEEQVDLESLASAPESSRSSSEQVSKLKRMSTFTMATDNCAFRGNNSGPGELQLSAFHLELAELMRQWYDLSTYLTTQIDIRDKEIDQLVPRLQHNLTKFENRKSRDKKHN